MLYIYICFIHVFVFEKRDACFTVFFFHSVYVSLCGPVTKLSYIMGRIHENASDMSYTILQDIS